MSALNYKRAANIIGNLPKYLEKLRDMNSFGVMRNEDSLNPMALHKKNDVVSGRCDISV